MAKFVNPYNFAALWTAQRNAPIAFHLKFTGKSGVIECSLQALTRIFIPSRLDVDVERTRLGYQDRRAEIAFIPPTFRIFNFP